MKEVLLSLQFLDMWILLSTILYGVRYGIGNILHKCICLFTKRMFYQSNLCKSLDTLFIIGIMYLTIFTFEVI